MCVREWEDKINFNCLVLHVGLCFFDFFILCNFYMIYKCVCAERERVGPAYRCMKCVSVCVLLLLNFTPLCLKSRPLCYEMECYL